MNNKLYGYADKLQDNGIDGVTVVESGGAITVDLPNNSMGGTTVTHDDYVEIDVGGVTKKVMTGS